LCVLEPKENHLVTEDHWICQDHSVCHWRQYSVFEESSWPHWIVQRNCFPVDNVLWNTWGFKFLLHASR